MGVVFPPPPTFLSTCEPPPRGWREQLVPRCPRTSGQPILYNGHLWSNGAPHGCPGWGSLQPIPPFAPSFWLTKQPGRGPVFIHVLIPVLLVLLQVAGTGTGWDAVGLTLGVGRRHWGARRHQGDPGDTRGAKPQPIGTTRGVAKQHRWVRLRTSMDGDSATGDSMGGRRPWVEDVHGCKVYYG